MKLNPGPYWAITFEGRCVDIFECYSFPNKLIVMQIFGSSHDMSKEELEIYDCIRVTVEEVKE